MAPVFEQISSPSTWLQDRSPATPPSPDEDEVALGWECATPSLALEGWDPHLAAALLLSSKS